MKRLTLSLLLLCVACGEPTDREQDCNASEFFEQGTQRCQPCPTLTASACDETCGFTIEPSETTQCPEVVCAMPGACLCSSPERFDPELLACVAP